MIPRWVCCLLMWLFSRALVLKVLWQSGCGQVRGAVVGGAMVGGGGVGAGAVEVVRGRGGLGGVELGL
jgi:hypothetical protein